MCGFKSVTLATEGPWVNATMRSLRREGARLRPREMPLGVPTAHPPTSRTARYETSSTLGEQPGRGCEPFGPRWELAGSGGRPARCPALAAGRALADDRPCVRARCPIRVHALTTRRLGLSVGYPPAARSAARFQDRGKAVLIGKAAMTNLHLSYVIDLLHEVGPLDSDRRGQFVRCCGTLRDWLPDEVLRLLDAVRQHLILHAPAQEALLDPLWSQLVRSSARPALSAVGRRAGADCGAA